MSSPINKSKESKDLIDFDCDFNSPTHKFSEIQLMFDPLIPTSVTSDKNKRYGHVFLNPYAEPSDTSNECKTEHSPFDLMLDYSSGPIGSHLVKPDELLLPHTVMDANNVLKDENLHLSNKKLTFPSVMDVQYDTCSAKPQVSICWLYFEIGSFHIDHNYIQNFDCMWSLALFRYTVQET